MLANATCAIDMPSNHVMPALWQYMVLLVVLSYAETRALISGNDAVGTSRADAAMSCLSWAKAGP